MRISYTLLIGIIVLVLSLVGGGYASYMAFLPLTKDPADEAEHIIDPPATAELEKGDYDIWLISSETRYDEQEILIIDSGNESVTIEKSSGSVKLQSDKYVLYGKMEIPADGTYNIKTEYNQTLYITPPLNVEENFVVCCGALCLTSFFILIGFLLVIIGIVLQFKSKRKK